MRYLIVLSLLSVAVACTDTATPKRKVKPVVKKTKVVQEPVETDLLSDVPDRIFGLPVPDRVTHHRTFADSVRIMTKNDLQTIHAFFKKELVDYEIVEAGRGYVAVGLQPYQGRLEYRRKGRLQYPVEIIYRDRKPKPVEQVVAAKTAKPKKGDKVEIRLPNGELLAPGARWGESYTPPPNSPLNKKKYLSLIHI